MNKPTRTGVDDVLLQSMIDQTQFQADPTPDEAFWYSFPNQKKLAFNVATGLLAKHDMEPSEAVETAKNFIDHFYKEVIAPNAWTRSR